MEQALIVNGSLCAQKLVIGPVAILPDGSIERTATFTTTDEAALQFWAAIDQAFPTFLRGEEEWREATASFPYHVRSPS